MAKKADITQTLEEAMKSLEKKYGQGVVINGNHELGTFDVISTGSIGLDLALGHGGFPLGRIVEILAPESCGKTSIALQTIANAQKKGLNCAFIDMEHALSAEYATSLGVDMENLILSQPDYGEQALDVAITLCKTGQISVIVIDSVAALVPQSELEGNVGDSSIGKQARMMSQVLRMITPIAEKNNTLIIFLNQIRMKIGVMFGSPEVGAGGEGLKYYSSIRIDLRKQILKDGDEAYANKTKAKIIKNKIAPPFKIAEFEIEFGQGINRIKEVIDFASELEIIKIWGKSLTYKDNKIEVGDDKVQFMKDNPELYNEIETQVLEKLNIK